MVLRMEELNRKTDAAARKKTPWGRLLRILLWVVGIWAALLIILQVILSSGAINRIVEEFTSEYIDGDLGFESVKVNMFRHFPYVGIVIKNGSLTYPADRFDSLERQSVQGRLMYRGCGEKADTLASFRHFSAGVDLASLMAGKIHISHVVMVKPRIFAHAYDEENANWNIFKLPESQEDTTDISSGLPPISIGRISLTSHPHIVYTDSRDTLFAMIDVKKITFDGRLNTRKTSRNRIGLSLDSMIIAGRMAADTIGLRMDGLHIHEHNDHMDIHAHAKALLATRAFGRMHVPIEIKGTAAFPKDTVPVIAMNGFKAEIAAIPIDFDMTVRMEDKLHLDGRFKIDNCKAEDIIDDFLKNIIPETKKVKTDASLSLSGTCNGYIGGGKLPAVDISVAIPHSSVTHRDVKHELHLALDADVRTDGQNRLNVGVDELHFCTYGLQFEAHGGASDILGDDPLINIDGSLKAAADSLLTFLPEDSDITAEGNLDVDLKGSMRLSQMDIYNFGQAEMYGKATSGKLILKSPKDTIDVNIEGMTVNISPETKISKVDSMEFKLLAISGNITKADISLKDALSVKASDLDLAAKNSIEAMAGHDSRKIHPLGGHLNARELIVADGKGMSLTLDESATGFQMVPKKSNAEIPVLSLNSKNKRIYVRDLSNRIILTDSRIHLGAAMNSIERRQRMRMFMDSVALAHPELPRDSIMPFLRAQRQAQTARVVIPEWMKEEDFKEKDLNFTLDGVIADYFRKWDIDGKVDVRTGILMTPMLPLRNILKGMSLSFSNNEVKIDSLKMMAGNSELGARGSLTGLRRALLGRGTYDLDMEFSTDRMDAAELLAALNTGAAIDTDAAGMSGASDSEFLKMVVADSLDTENVNTLIVVPSNVNADIKVNAGNIRFSDLLIEEFKADVVMKERCMQIVNASAATNMGKAAFEGFYATRTKEDIKTGFNLEFTDVTSEKVISMMPAIDTIMPLLKSFKGQLDCELAATADLDTLMNAIMPSINGVIRISGENMTMSDNKVFTDLAKTLKFKNTKKAKIDKMTVEGVIKDNVLEVFPFILDLDRYTLALSGLQNLDMSYRYHASIIQSPILFKIGVDIYGPSFDKMKFKIGKPKYKSTKIPVFTTVIDQTRLNLAESIRNIFEKGVELAVMENEKQNAIEGLKKDIGYVNAAEQKMEELSEEEQKQLEEEQKRAEQETAEGASAQIDSTSIANTLNKIILKEKQDNE